MPKWYDGKPMSVPDGVLDFKMANEQYEAVIMNGAMGFEVSTGHGQGRG
jgi:hypothetical protein